jgi:hypothetical protein
MLTLVAVTVLAEIRVKPPHTPKPHVHVVVSEAPTKVLPLVLQTHILVRDPCPLYAVLLAVATEETLFIEAHYPLLSLGW